MAAAALFLFWFVGTAGAVLSAVRTLSMTPPPSAVGGANTPATLLRYYGLTGEAAIATLSGLMFLVAVACLVAGLCLRRRKGGDPESAVPLPREESDSSDAVASSPLEGRPVRVYRSRLQGATLHGGGKRSRRQVLATLSVGDRLLFRNLPREDDETAVGVLTLSGEQIGYLDRGLVREINERYPGHRIGIMVESVRGGQGLAYEGELRVVVYAMEG